MAPAAVQTKHCVSTKTMVAPVLLMHVSIVAPLTPSRSPITITRLPLRSMSAILPCPLLPREHPDAIPRLGRRLQREGSRPRRHHRRRIRRRGPLTLVGGERVPGRGRLREAHGAVVRERVRESPRMLVLRGRGCFDRAERPEERQRRLPPFHADRVELDPAKIGCRELRRPRADDDITGIY